MRWFVAAAAALLVAGCLDASDGPPLGHTAVPDAPVSPEAPLPPTPCAAPCSLGLQVDVPADFDGWLTVRATWDGTAVPDLSLAIVAPDGTRTVATRGFDDRMAWVFDVQPGRYLVEVGGQGAAMVSAQLGSLAVPANGPKLPNLVELVIEGPAVGPCDEVERTEQGAVTCMRFGNGVGNPGDGSMQIRLTVDQGATALVPLGGHFSQEVHLAEGGIEAHPVGPASFHATHSHWHYDGFALFELYEVDESPGLRGALASAHHKSGFCFLDWDKMPEAVTVPAEQERAEADCLIPGLSLLFGGSPSPQSATWTNGISRGWYDFYEPYLTDQYVDIDGLAAGVYELVATADPGHTLDELDVTDNQSSLLLRIAGTDVEVLEERGHYRVTEDDDL